MQPRPMEGDGALGRTVNSMRRLLDGARSWRLVGSQVFADTRWIYAALTLLVGYSVFAAITLWSLFH